jgi:hypothetical protein
MKQTAYGSSKAALNYVTRKMRFENDGLGERCVCDSHIREEDLTQHRSGVSDLSRHGHHRHECVFPGCFDQNA